MAGTATSSPEGKATPAIAKDSDLAIAEREIYFISGLGADWRVFQRLQLEGYRPVHILWQRPDRHGSRAGYQADVAGFCGST